MLDTLPRGGLLGATRRVGYLLLSVVSILMHSYLSWIDPRDSQYEPGVVLSIIILIVTSIQRISLKAMDVFLVLMINIGMLNMIYNINNTNSPMSARDVLIYMLFLVVWFGILPLKWALLHAFCLLTIVFYQEQLHNQSDFVILLGYFVFVIVVLMQMTVAGKRIQEERLMAEHFAYLAMRDQLTSLYNRRVIQEKLQEFYQNIKKDSKQISKQRLGVLLIDIDHFKQVNDQQGHQIGDKVLQQIAQILQKCARKNDLVGRWGGEEFLIIVDNSDHKKLQEMCLDIQQALFKIPQDLPRITVSIGMAQSDEVDNLDTLLRFADRRLYRAKDNGRNQANMDSLNEV